MRVGIIVSTKKWETDWARALSKGLSRRGHTVYFGDDVCDTLDAVAFVGVKRKADFDRYRDQGVTTLLFDKGYNRRKVDDAPLYWRVAINAHSCTDMIDMDAPADRLHTLGVELMPWRKSGEHILFAGSSAKYHNFYDLPPPEKYVYSVLQELEKYTDRSVHYRPKPTYRDAVKVPGASFGSQGRIYDAMKGVHAVVTHGSNACFDAVCAGIPCIVLGNGVARPISSTCLSEIEAPLMASDADRKRWLAGLSYWQWTLKELANGEALEYIEGQMQ